MILFAVMFEMQNKKAEKLVFRIIPGREVVSKYSPSRIYIQNYLVEQHELSQHPAQQWVKQAENRSYKCI